MAEFWLIDPFEKQMTFYTRVDERFVTADAEVDCFFSQAIPGFRFDESHPETVPRMNARVGWHNTERPQIIRHYNTL